MIWKIANIFSLNFLQILICQTVCLFVEPVRGCYPLNRTLPGLVQVLQPSPTCVLEPEEIIHNRNSSADLELP